MAQIVISTIDTASGAITTAFKMKDEHLSRIFKAYKYLQAVNYLNQKKQNNEILEASDTVENIIDQLSSEDVVQEFAKRLIKDMVNLTNQIELRIVQEKYNNTIEQIQWSL